MDKSSDWKFPRLRSDPAVNLMTPGVAFLLKQSELNITTQEVITLANTIQEDVRKGYKDLLSLDQRLGGVGFHNVNRSQGECLTGNYRVEFRPIFRPIQYAFRDMFGGDLVWDARRVIQWSCGHVEDSIKYRFRIPEHDRASLGILLNRRPQIEKELESHLLEWLRNLNQLVYRDSKHSLEETTVDAHRFTPADALAIYLLCRWIGVSLLEPTGLFDEWMSTDR